MTERMALILPRVAADARETVKPAKALLIVAGYVGAALVAGAAVAVHVASTSGPDRQSASGMFAFGDSLLFLGAFSAVATVPTGAALFFLRDRPRFWRVLAIATALIAATALPAPVLYYAHGSWGAPAVLRVLIAPVLALFGFLCALLAPAPSPRRLLLVAAAVELAAFTSVAARWVLGW
jgi:predicted membrane channel-forming protein YqfA (hemolysin III family)